MGEKRKKKVGREKCDEDKERERDRERERERERENSSLTESEQKCMSEGDMIEEET